MRPAATLKAWAGERHDFSRWRNFQIVMLLFVLSGVFGFVYETIFYRIDLGHFVKRGTTLGPWIPIYAYGAVFILLLAYRFRKRPWAVFLLGAISSGALEFAAGYYFWHVRHIRLWDYNTEIWNWGNVGGYICARSVLFFGLSGLILVYLMVPMATHLAGRLQKRAFALVSLLPAALFAAAILYSLIK